MPYKPRRHLRSEAKGLLDEPRTRLKFGDPAFSHSEVCFTVKDLSSSMGNPQRGQKVKLVLLSNQIPQFQSRGHCLWVKGRPNNGARAFEQASRT